MGSEMCIRDSPFILPRPLASLLLELGSLFIIQRSIGAISKPRPNYVRVIFKFQTHKPWDGVTLPCVVTHNALATIFLKQRMIKLVQRYP